MNVLLASFLIAMASAKTADQPKPTVRTIPVSRTPESSTVKLVIAVPKNNQVVEEPVWIQFRIDGFALGAASQFERASEVVQTDMGQTIHVVIDDHPYFPINEPALDPFDEGGFYYDTSYKFKVPFNLNDGAHTIRMFPARSFGESLKGDNTFAAMHFYVGERKDTPTINLTKPFLTYNEPSNEMDLTEDQPILLDFYLSNAELSSDGYKVRLSIDGHTERVITAWQPYYIYGLKKGKHKIRLELLNSRDKLVSGPSTDVSQTIMVH